MCVYQLLFVRLWLTWVYMADPSLQSVQEGKGPSRRPISSVSKDQAETINSPSLPGWLLQEEKIRRQKAEQAINILLLLIFAVSRSLLHYSHLIIVLKTPCVSVWNIWLSSYSMGTLDFCQQRKNTRVTWVHYTVVLGEKSSLGTCGPSFNQVRFTHILLLWVKSYLTLPVELCKCCLQPNLTGNIYKSMKNR